MAQQGLCRERRSRPKNRRTEEAHSRRESRRSGPARGWSRTPLGPPREPLRSPDRHLLAWLEPAQHREGCLPNVKRAVLRPLVPVGSKIGAESCVSFHSSTAPGKETFRHSTGANG